MSPDDLAAIHTALQDDQVYVHPSMSSILTPEAEARLSADLATLTDPTYVVVWPYTSSDDFGGKAADLLTRLHRAHPEPGVYLSNNQLVKATEYTSVRVDGRQWGIPSEDDGEIHPWEVLSLIGLEDHQDLASALDRTVEVLAMPVDELDELHGQVLDAHSAEYRRENPSAYDEDSGGSLPGIVTGGAVLVVALVAVLVAVRRMSTRRRSSAAKLPPSALAKVRAARDQALRARAEQSSLALGEELDQREIAPSDDRESWEAALDHYAQARRLMERPDAPVLDVVGAIVLAERGSRALELARRGKVFAPARPCFLNPLHGNARGDRPVELDGRAVDVPLCQECRTALEKDRSPDILDVMHDGEPRHYFETDVEPWASSGYGALEPDLVKLLQTRR